MFEGKRVGVTVPAYNEERSIGSVVSNMPSFVVDAYTIRLMKRHGLLNGSEKYEDVKSLIEKNIPEDTLLYNEFHALLVRLGKEHCKPRPKCAGCPLEPYL